MECSPLGRWYSETLAAALVGIFFVVMVGALMGGFGIYLRIWSSTCPNSLFEKSENYLMPSPPPLRPLVVKPQARFRNEIRDRRRASLTCLVCPCVILAGACQVSPGAVVDKVLGACQVSPGAAGPRLHVFVAMEVRQKGTLR